MSAEAKTEAAVDPIVFSLVLHRLNSIATEMTVTLEHAAMTSILAFARDYSCCIYDVQRRQIAMVDALPIHTTSLGLLLDDIVEFFGDEIGEGDVILCNDPYHGNTHIGDLVTLYPVFVDGQHLFWTVVKGHQLDVGAPIPHSSNPFALDVWQEGMTIPPVKLVDRGRMRRDVLELYLANMRWRDLLEGDLMAQLGSCWTGGTRLVEMCAEFGTDEVAVYVEEALRYASERTAAELRQMPRGTFRGRAWMDTDGGARTDLPITVDLTLAGDQAQVAFVEPPEQAKAGVNSTYAVMQAAGAIPVVMTLDPDVPHNDGCLNRISVTADEGTLYNATFPASTAAATILPGDAMQEAVARALAEAVPERVPAGSARWGNVPMFSGTDASTGTSWGHQVGNCGGGGGAALGIDGWPLLTTYAAAGGLKTASVEHTELLYPLMFDEWEIEPESMGFGEQIGGPGIACTVRALDGGVDVIGVSDGLRTPPYGLNGGTAGAGGGAYLCRPDGGREPLDPTFHLHLGPGEGWSGVSSGGGGYGDPLARPAEAVRADVRDGLYGVATALEIFGVVVSDDVDPVLDEAATTARRAELARTRPQADGARLVPTAPDQARWRRRPTATTTTTDRETAQ